MDNLAFVNDENKKDLALALNLLKNFPSGCRRDLIVENLHKTPIFALIMARLHGDGGHSKQIIVDLINKVFENNPNKILQNLSNGLKEDKKKKNIDTVFIEFIVAFLNKDYQELSKLANSNVNVCEKGNQAAKEVIFLDYLFNQKDEELAELKFVIEMFKISSGKGNFKDYYQIPEAQRNAIEKIVSLDILALSAAISAGEYVKIWKFLAKKENYDQNKESLMIYCLITTCNIPKFVKTDNTLIFNLVLAGFGGLIFKGMHPEVFPCPVIEKVKQILDATYGELIWNFNQRDNEDFLQVEIGLGDRNYDAEGTWFSNEFLEFFENVHYFFPIIEEIMASTIPHMIKELDEISKRLLSSLGNEHNLSLFFVIGTFFVSFSGIVKFNIFEEFLEGNSYYFLQQQVKNVAIKFHDYAAFIKSFIVLITAGFDKVRKHQTNSLAFTEKYVGNEMESL